MGHSDGDLDVRAVSLKRHRFPADVIRQAVWLYFRFTLSFRDVEELLAQRGIEVSYETIRFWTFKFGPLIAPRRVAGTWMYAARPLPGSNIPQAGQLNRPFRKGAVFCASCTDQKHPLNQ